MPALTPSRGVNSQVDLRKFYDRGDNTQRGESLLYIHISLKYSSLLKITLLTER